MRLQIFDILDEMEMVGEIRIDESQGYPEVIFSQMIGQEALDRSNT
jgi:hypothetical protein